MSENYRAGRTRIAPSPERPPKSHTKPICWGSLIKMLSHLIKSLSFFDIYTQGVDLFPIFLSGTHSKSNKDCYRRFSYDEE